MHEKMNKVNKILEMDLEKKLDQVIAAGTVSPEDVKVMKDAVKLMLKFKEYEEWEMSENGSSYSNGYSSMRGRSQNTGRYMSRDTAPYNTGYSSRRSYNRMPYQTGYSGHTMIEKFERLYDEAQNEQDRQMIGEMIDRLEMNQ